ncbi:MAG: DNA alkylation repair protein [Lachnospiraceae bacterium]|nr:DNA alkylation repair protein [Lachnospiraceae bacterium]
MKESTRQQLVLLSEKKYREFSAALVPGEEKMLGVRLPKLREMARKLAKDNWKEELATEDFYFEEIMLRGMVISYATMRMEPEEAMVYITDFIPRVNNWSVCDSVFMKMDILKKNRDLTWDFIQPYLRSRDEFRVRVALVIMMAHLLRCDSNGKKMSRFRNITMSDLENIDAEKEKAGKYLSPIFEKINRSFTEGYYAHMAAAWLVAEAFCCFPALTNRFLNESKLDDVTYNKALQKIIESKIPEDEVKCYIRGLKK